MTRRLIRERFRSWGVFPSFLCAKAFSLTLSDLVPLVSHHCSQGGVDKAACMPSVLVAFDILQLSDPEVHPIHHLTPKQLR